MVISVKIKKRDYRALSWALLLLQFRKINALALEPFALRILKAQLNLFLRPIEVNQGKVILRDQLTEAVRAGLIGIGPGVRHATGGELIQGVVGVGFAFVDSTNVSITGQENNPFGLSFLHELSHLF